MIHAVRCVAVFLLSGISLLRSAVPEQYWFAPPAISSTLGDSPIELIISTTKAVNIRIVMPANGSFPEMTFSINADSAHVVDLTAYKTYLQPTGYASAGNTGLLIETSDVVDIQYRVAAMGNREVYNLKGSAAMGKRFLAPGQDRWHRAGAIALNSLDIVASRDGTVLSITLPAGVAAGGELAGSTFTIPLDRGETYALRNDGDSTANLRGVLIRSTELVAVTYTEDGVVNGSATDLAGDQLMPVYKHGTKHGVVRGNLKDGGTGKEFILIMALEPTTEVIVNTITYNLTDVGDYLFLELTSNKAYVSSDKEVSVFHYSGQGEQLSLSLVPPLDLCVGVREVQVYRPESDTLVIILIVPAGGQGKFTATVEGTTFGTFNFTNDLGDDIHKWGKIVISTGNVPAGTSFNVVNSAENFFIYVMHGNTSGGAEYYSGMPVNLEGLTAHPIYHFNP